MIKELKQWLGNTAGRIKLNDYVNFQRKTASTCILAAKNLSEFI